MTAWLAACLLLAAQPPVVRTFFDELDRPICQCVMEDAAASPLLDEAWIALQYAEGVKAKRSRPRFCFIPEPLFVILPGLHGRPTPGFMFGYYNPKRNDVLLAFVPDADELACNGIHEFVHALMGKGHPPEFAGWMKKAGCP